MKLNRHKSHSGSALVMTLVTGVLVGMVLGSYLVLINNRNQAAMRAMAWNSAIPVLEAGIEEALSHLNEDRANPPAFNNWAPVTVDGKPAYFKTRSLPDGSYYSVTNFNVTSNSPSLISAGYVRSPLNDKAFISRMVRVQLTNPPSPFYLAIAANHTIRLSGNATVDGYDSRLGDYDPLSNRNADGNIGTDSTESSAISVGSGHIYGNAVTGAGGTVDVSGGGSVGDTNWNSGIETGWTNDNMSVEFQSNAPPADTALFSPVRATSLGTSNMTYLDAGNSYINVGDFVTKFATGPIIVRGGANGGDVTLYVTGKFVVNGEYYVQIEPNAKLTLYVGGSTTSISGLGVINQSGKPNNFSYVGLASNTSLTYNGRSDFVGKINAPQASFNLSGSSSLFGAVICDSFSSSGSGSVHYDRALTGTALLTVTSWRELPAN